jgi:hypothetical protein
MINLEGRQNGQESHTHFASFVEPDDTSIELRACYGEIPSEFLIVDHYLRTHSTDALKRLKSQEAAAKIALGESEGAGHE